MFINLLKQVYTGLYFWQKHILESQIYLSIYPKLNQNTYEVHTYVTKSHNCFTLKYKLKKSAYHFILTFEALMFYI